jgi:hypothetical protein
MLPSIPSDYSNYIRENGLFEGFTMDEVLPGYIELWAVEKIAGINAEIEIEIYAPGFIAFAGNGGGEILAFDKKGFVYMLPLVGMEPEVAVRIADNFQELTRRFVR